MIRIVLFCLLCGLGLKGAGQSLQVKKFTPALNSLLMQVEKGGAPDSVDLVVQWKGAPGSTAHRLIRQYGTDLQLVRVAGPLFQNWLQQKELAFAGLYQAPTEELTSGSLDITLNRLNAAHYYFPDNKGAGIHLSIKEQRFDTSDIDLRGRILSSGVEATMATTHASLMATIAAGGGNTSGEAVGAAPAALVSAASFASLLPDADTLLQKLGVQVQNHSYGTAVENLYGIEAAAYDRQAESLPLLLHVFSAGNSGQAAGTGKYAGLQGRANLSGNYKQGKNVLTIGGLDYLGSVSATSSKGPAFDGRVKPELAAFGEDGTSGAAALVSGTAALLQEAYLGANRKPAPSALLRAVLINSAFAIGAPGPNYHSGWGGLDGLAALRTLHEKRYQLVQLARSQVQTIPLQVPEGVQSLKVTVSWVDRASDPGTGKSLINDLDLVLERQGSGDRWLPWILNPHPDSVDLPARRGVDTLNNNEQVTIDNPAPGTYLIKLEGFGLKHSLEQVALAWQMDTARSFAFTFPLRNDALLAGQSTYVRWQGRLPAGAVLEYSLNGGSWKSLEVGSSGEQCKSWQVPQHQGSAQLRMRTNSGFVMSDTFVVTSRPALQVGFFCADSVMLHWPATAPAYQLYQLGERYMTPLLQVRDTFAIVRVQAGSSPIFGIAPLMGGVPGVHSYGFNSREAGVGCYFKSFFVQEQTAGQILLQASLGTLYGVQELRLQKRTADRFLNIGSGLGPRLSYSIADIHPVKGYNFYRLALTLTNGKEVFSEPLAVFHFGNNPVQVFPNPARSGSVLNIQSSLPGKYEVQVFDLFGRLFHRTKLQDLNSHLTINWPAGVYLFKVFSDEGLVETARLVVL